MIGKVFVIKDNTKWKKKKKSKQKPTIWHDINKINFVNMPGEKGEEVSLQG